MFRKVSLEEFLNVFNVWIKLQVEELRRLKEIRNKASSAGREAKIDQFATERTPAIYWDSRAPKWGAA